MTQEKKSSALLTAAQTIRFLSVDMVQKANSGHPGMPMGMADVAAVLWGRFLKHNPKDTSWADRDRFVMSGGHGSALLYSLLHVSGYDLPLDQLKQFRQLDSLTPGHPEFRHTPGVETTTGPLGQGVANAVGMALAEKWLSAHFNKPGHSVVDHRTWVFAGDGDLMEGISHEACTMASHLGLSKLTLFFDDNGITIDGPTNLSSCEDTLARFESYGWHTQRIDGHDQGAIEAAINNAVSEVERPSLVACRTHIGYGSPNRQDTSKAHGEPLGEDEVVLAKKKMGWPVEPTFLVPAEALDCLQAQARDGKERQQAWDAAMEQYAEAFPDLAQQLGKAMSGALPAEWYKEAPAFAVGQKIATRAASGAAVNALAGQLPTLIGGSADLSPSNNTRPRSEAAISRSDLSGRYIHFGVREHAMGGILNGLALHGGLRPYGGTFLVFSDYMRSAIRMAALMDLPVVYVFTHDSIGLGEDGPTHQPIEHVMSLRSMPNLAVIRPGDAEETMVAWRSALLRKGPTALCLTRQKLPVLDRQKLASAEGALRGGYILSDTENAKVILLATGSEVHLALEAQKTLAEKNIAARVVSMPCWELFEEQDSSYQQQVLPDAITARVSVEAGVTLGWNRYLGSTGEAVGIDHYGASAPAPQLFEKFGLNVQAVVAAAERCCR